MKMRVAIILGLTLVPLYGQTCAPSRILPVGAVSSRLDDSNCQLSDATAYESFRLDLPKRGQLQLGLTSDQDFFVTLRDSSGLKVDSGVSLNRLVEAGSYSLRVNARTPGQIGAYSLKTSFSAETSTLCSGFPSLGLNQTVSGMLGASGCTLPDGTPYEAYTLSTFGPGTLTIQAASADFNTALILRADGGAALAMNSSKISLPVDGDSQYQVVIYTGDATGSYQLTTSFQPDDTATCRASKSFTDIGADDAAITAQSCTVTIPGSGDLWYYSYYTINASTAGTAGLSATSGDFLPTINVLDNGGNMIASDSGGGGLNTSEVMIPLKPGTYTAEVISSIPSGGSYKFSYTLTPGSPQHCNPTVIDPSSTSSAALSSTSCRTHLGLTDLYTVTLPASGTLDATLSSGSFSAHLAIRDSKENDIVVNEDVQGLGATHVAADLPAGTYTIAAASVSGTGLYQMTAQFTAKDLTACAYVQPIDSNGGYIQKLGLLSCRNSFGQPVDFYEFTLPSDSMVAAIMTSNEIDSYLELTDTSGNLLRSDDNSYGGSDSLILQYLPAGTYRLAAHAASSTVGGYYEVDVRSIAGSKPPLCTPRASLDMGATATGTINFAGCQYTDASFADIYAMKLAADATVDLRLSSKDFDAAIILLDARGNVLDQDDDGGGGTNSRIVQMLGAGTYYVVAKPFTDYTSGGDYTLSLTQQ